MTVTARRIRREAALDNAFVGKSFTIIATVSLPAGSTKFVAWITGARGLNGLTVRNDETGSTHTTGRTTVLDAIKRNAITNPDYLANPLTATADETDGYDLALAESVGTVAEGDTEETA
jgi:hypothetical protein